MSTIEFDTEDIMWIGGNLYCLTPESLAVVLERLRTIGYNAEDMRDPETLTGKHRAERGVTVEMAEADPYCYLWYINLQDIRQGKCGSCNELISTLGIHSHGHTCEKCGAVTYRKFVDGTEVKFYFRGVERPMFAPDLWMPAKRWDAEEGYLYLKCEFIEDHGLFAFTPEQAEEYLLANSDKWELVEEDGEKLVKVRYVDSFYVDPESTISLMDYRGDERNFRIVKVWDGVEYSEHSPDFPLRESYHIFECWRWERLEPSPTLHKKVLHAIGNHDDKGWHYQDGRPWFRPESFRQMGLFVRYFTTLDADAWDEQSRRFRLDGPGGIDDVARFCHPDAEVEDRPNIGNFINGLTSFGSGRPMTEREARAMKRAVDEDPDTQDFVKGFVTGEMPRRR